MEPTKQSYRSVKSALYFWKPILFFGLIAILGLIGLMWFARPKTSTIEKRELTPFPQLTWEGLWDGSFFSGVDENGNNTGVEGWYADTYPLREPLIALNMAAESLRGNRQEQMISGGQTADEIPDGPVDLAELAGLDTKPTEPSAPPDSSAPDESGDATAPSGTEAPTEPPEGQGDVTQSGETSGPIYITQNCGYGVYYFSQSGSARYCLAVNNVAKALEGKAKVYCLIGPISAGIMLSDEVRAQTGGTDENEAMTWMFDNMDPLVGKVNVYHILKQHNNEYIYFHTDHHWTALGAYYAYCEFCKVKGIEPHSLSDFQTYEFPGFLGTFYSSSNRSPALAANPDTVTAYIPNGTNSMEMYVKGGGTYTRYDWRIVNDVSDYVKSELYATFAGGDQPFNYAHNEEIKDGSSVLIVKDSYGNAFIPFLVDHYEHIYWIDYRHYAGYCRWAGLGDTSISALVAREGIQDVILCNNINSTGADGLLDDMEELFR